jgi:hypothetical protein
MKAEYLRNPQSCERICRKILSTINNGFEVNFFYIKGTGFIVQRSISVKNQDLLDGGNGFMIAAYGLGARQEYIIEDYNDAVDDARFGV